MNPRLLRIPRRVLGELIRSPSMHLAILDAWVQRVTERALDTCCHPRRGPDAGHALPEILEISCWWGTLHLFDDDRNGCLLVESRHQTGSAWGAIPWEVVRIPWGTIPCAR